MTHTHQEHTPSHPTRPLVLISLSGLHSETQSNQRDGQRRAGTAHPSRHVVPSGRRATRRAWWPPWADWLLYTLLSFLAFQAFQPVSLPQVHTSESAQARTPTPHSRFNGLTRLRLLRRRVCQRLPRGPALGRPRVGARS